MGLVCTLYGHDWRVLESGEHAFDFHCSRCGVHETHAILDPALPAPDLDPDGEFG